MQSRKWKEDRYPKKLTNFFTMPATAGETWQDGADGDSTQASSSYTDRPDDNPGSWADENVLPPSQSPHPPSSEPNSPAKARMRMDPMAQASGAECSAASSDQVGLNEPSLNR